LEEAWTVLDNVIEKRKRFAEFFVRVDRLGLIY